MPSRPARSRMACTAAIVGPTTMSPSTVTLRPTKLVTSVTKARTLAPIRSVRALGNVPTPSTRTPSTNVP